MSSFKNIKFWPHKEARTVLVEVDRDDLSLCFELDLDAADAAHVDFGDAIRLVKEDWIE